MEAESVCCRQPGTNRLSPDSNAVTVDVGNGTAKGARRCGPSLVNFVSPLAAWEEEPHGASQRTCSPTFRRVGDCDAENAATVHYVSEVHHLKRGGSLL